MRGDKVEIAAAARRRSQSLSPGHQGSGIPEQVAVQQQGRQRKLIDPMCLVTFSKVTDIFFMRHVGFSDQSQRHPLYVDQTTQDAHHHMCFRQAHAGSANSLPQIRDGIEPNIAGTVSGIKEQYSGELHKHIGVREVQIYLVFTECGPDALNPLACMHFGEQGRIPRTQHLTKTRIRCLLVKIIFARGRIGYVVGKPNMLSRAVVDHQIYHQVKTPRQVLNIWPVTEISSYFLVVDHGEPIIGGGREKRQNVNAADHTVEMGLGKLGKRLQRHRARPLHAVAIANQNSLGSGRCEDWFLLLCHRTRRLTGHFAQILMHALALLRAVQLNQVRHHFIVDSLDIGRRRRNSGWVGRPVQRQSLFGHRCEALSSRARVSLHEVRDNCGLKGPSHCAVSPRSVFQSMPVDIGSNHYHWASFAGVMAQKKPSFGVDECRA